MATTVARRIDVGPVLEIVQELVKLHQYVITAFPIKQRNQLKN
jgi:hypothetical protein